MERRGGGKRGKGEEREAQSQNLCQLQLPRRPLALPTWSVGLNIPFFFLFCLFRRAVICRPQFKDFQYQAANATGARGRHIRRVPPSPLSS